MENKTLLVLAASIYQIPTILCAQRLGFRVITADNVPENPGHSIANESFVIDTTDEQGIYELAKRNRVSGIIASCTDVAVPTSAFVAEQMGLRGVPYESAKILCDKIRFRQFLTEHGIPRPSYFECRDAVSVTNDLFDGVTTWVIKPDCSSGSKGVFVVRDYDEFLTRFGEAHGFSPSGRVIVEQFIEGEQGTCEGFVVDGNVVFACLLDRQTAPRPFVATHGHRVPTVHTERVQARVLATIENLLSRMEVTAGPFDCDFVFDGEDVYIIELTPRLGGNSIASLLTIATGVNLVEASVLNALGVEVSFQECDAIIPSAVLLLGADRDGLLCYDPIEVDRLRIEPWVESISFDIDIGSPIRAFTDGRHRVGEAFITGVDRTDLDNKADELIDRIGVCAS